MEALLPGEKRAKMIEKNPLISVEYNDDGVVKKLTVSGISIRGEGSKEKIHVNKRQIKDLFCSNGYPEFSFSGGGKGKYAAGTMTFIVSLFSGSLETRRKITELFKTAYHVFRNQKKYFWSNLVWPFEKTPVSLEPSLNPEVLASYRLARNAGILQIPGLSKKKWFSSVQRAKELRAMAGGCLVIQTPDEVEIAGYTLVKKEKKLATHVHPAALELVDVMRAFPENIIAKFIDPVIAGCPRAHSIIVPEGWGEFIPNSTELVSGMSPPQGKTVVFPLNFFRRTELSILASWMKRAMESGFTHKIFLAGSDMCAIAPGCTNIMHILKCTEGIQKVSRKLPDKLATPAANFIHGFNISPKETIKELEKQPQGHGWIIKKGRTPTKDTMYIPSSESKEVQLLMVFISTGDIFFDPKTQASKYYEFSSYISREVPVYKEEEEGEEEEEDEENEEEDGEVE